MRLIAATLFALVPLTLPALAGPKACPPGLVKKDPACVPPGLAKKGYGIGDRIDGDYTLIRNPDRWGLDDGKTYYRVGDTVYRVDPETKAVLDILGALVTLSN